MSGASGGAFQLVVAFRAKLGSSDQCKQERQRLEQRIFLISLVVQAKAHGGERVACRLVVAW